MELPVLLEKAELRLCALHLRVLSHERLCEAFLSTHCVDEQCAHKLIMDEDDDEGVRIR
jgi:hypothetical protein